MRKRSTDDGLDDVSFGDSSFDDPAGELNDDQWARLTDELAPDEGVVWAARASLPPTPTIAVFPAFFTAVLCGLSGYTLMVLFGIYGLVALQLPQMLFHAGLAPAALGSVITIGLIGRWVSYRRARWRLSRTFYALTDRRAFVGTDLSIDEPIWLCWWTPEMFDDTLVIEHANGTGDVFFVRDETVVSPELGLVGLRNARRVEELVRDTLLGESTDYFEA